MQSIAIRNDKFKPCPDPAEWASTANVDLNLTCSREFEGLTLDRLEHVCSQYDDAFDGLGSLGTPLITTSS